MQAQTVEASQLSVVSLKRFPGGSVVLPISHCAVGGAELWPRLCVHFV